MSSGIMICLELWYNSILVLLTGHLANAEVAIDTLSIWYVSDSIHLLPMWTKSVLSYHRNLTHRSFKLPKYLEYFFAYCGLLALQGDPILWVSTHRYHHKVSDTD
ncbi:palmitoyl-[glycerolipid] 7-desaturase [Ranunculus cassubicifolius]